MTDPVPTVAVVVVTRDRPMLLARCLAALAAQVRPPDEVIVVDDASAEPAAPVLAPFSDLLPLTLVRHENRGGPARARNAGWPAARSDYVAMTDDDCRPDPGWLASLLAVAAADRLVVGQTRADPEDGLPRSVFDRTMVVGDEGVRRFSTCNIIYPRALLASLEGYDETLTFYGEDTDLGLRAEAVGCDVEYQPGAIVYHAVHRPGAAATLRERWRVGGIVRLVRLHPELRSGHGSRWFWSRHHRQAALAIGTAAMLPLTPAALLMPAPWIRYANHRLNYHLGAEAGGPARRARHMASLFLLDAVELGACAWQSVRQRTVFL